MTIEVSDVVEVIACAALVAVATPFWLVSFALTKMGVAK